MESVGRVAVIDPITLAGTAELEAEAEAEAALGVNAMEREIAEMELNAEQTRDELKARELKVLTEKLGKEEARKRAALTVSPPRRPKPPQNAKRPQTAGRRPSARNTGSSCGGNFWLMTATSGPLSDDGAAAADGGLAVAARKIPPRKKSLPIIRSRSNGGRDSQCPLGCCPCGLLSR